MILSPIHGPYMGWDGAKMCLGKDGFHQLDRNVFQILGQITGVTTHLVHKVFTKHNYLLCTILDPARIGGKDAERDFVSYKC